MAICFVIQPFDKGGPYDKRYQDVLKPAIEAADLEAYRVDQDPGTTILIDDIEKGIREAEVCLADITTNNPNIWYEVGFALANGKSVVMICLDPRPEPYPFDIRHRKIISYKLHSSSDFEKLKSDIVSRLEAQAKKVEALQTVAAMSEMQTTEGLASHEIAVLVIIISENDLPDGALSAGFIKQKMSRSGYTPMAVGLALETLSRKAMIEVTEITDYENRESYPGYRLMPKGKDWLLANQSRFRMRKDDTEEVVEKRPTSTPITDEDIPF